MVKRGRKFLAYYQIFLLISLSFAISFFLSDNFVNAGILPVASENILAGRWEGNSFIFDSASAGASAAAPTIQYGAGNPYKAFDIINTGITGPAAHLVQGVVWAGVAYFAGKMIGGLFGFNDDQSNALGMSLAAGAFTYQGMQFLGESGYISQTGMLGNGLLPAVGVAAVVFILMYKKEKKKMVTFECFPFEPPIGGSKCEECNNDPFRPCSEYRCKALGQACGIVNPGTAEEKCVWVNPKDVTSPTIQPWNDALKPTGLKYTPDQTIRPPNRGVKIVNEGNNCLQAFTPLQFGITLNEPAQCKIDYNRNSTFEEMQFYFGENNYYLQNHTQRMALPAPEANLSEQSPLLQSDGTFSLYVRCQDANGNVNEDVFAFNFCVDPSPDTTPPVIQKTSINTGSPVQSGVDTVPIEVFVNEPAECKWSRESKSFDEMENTMTCNQETFQINADLTYTCKGELTSIKDMQENNFYFRCKDQPGKDENERNVNVQSYELKLRGSQALNILRTSPNETISGSTETVQVELQVETDDGSDEGKAVCYFSTVDESDSYIGMFETNSFIHKQKLDLTSGDYKYYFRCIDAGGNVATSSTEFKVDVDKQAPVVTRAYKEEGLKIVTNEDAQCVYSLQSCNYVFTEGLQMIYSNPSKQSNHYAEWNPRNTYYIKCKDFQENEPSPNACSIVVRAFDVSGSA